ncbi:MAG: gliding motility-associated C-terminal domain-containing protein, partial [Cytophagales bacterium]|nr:gliding motility-associated C-terminal domain-containing protein [Cytophagales bacterium]
DFQDEDSDGDGIPDAIEGVEDCDANGVPDYLDPYSCNEFEINQVITPNDDGINDLMIISGIENFPNNSVNIFNRWGVAVFSINGYDNNKNAFGGIVNNGNLLANSSRLPDGTYFYVINRGDGTPVQKGFVVIRK